MYRPEELPPQSRGLAVISGAMALIVILIMVQIWLLTATLESYLAGGGGMVAAAVFSGIMFAICVVLYIFVARVDAEVREQ